MNQNNELHLELSTEYDLIVDKGRTLNSIVNVTWLSGTTIYPFILTGYTGACMTIKNTAGTVLMQFNTNDGSLSLGTSSITFNKTAAEMDVVRSGEYAYDMYLIPVGNPTEKRAFFRGKITFINRVS